MSDFVEEVEEATDWVGDRVGGDVGNFLRDPLNWSTMTMFPNMMGDAIEQERRNMTPDYSGQINQQRAMFEAEKRRRATEANRVDSRGSQLARLFLSEDGADYNNNFMG